MSKLISKLDLRVLEEISTELSQKWQPDWYSRLNGKAVFFTVMLSWGMGMFASQMLVTFGTVLFFVHAGLTAWIHQEHGRYPGTPRWAVQMDLMDDLQKQRLSPILAKIEDATEREYWSSAMQDCFVFYKLMIVSKNRLN